MDKIKKPFNHLFKRLKKIKWPKGNKKGNNGKAFIRKKEHKSLRIPIAITLMVLMLTPVLSAMIYTYMQTTSILTERVEDQEQQITANLVSNIANAGSAAEETIKRLALDGVLNRVATTSTESDRNDLNSRFQYIVTGNPYIADVHFIPADPEKEFVSTLSVVRGHQDPYEIFTWFESGLETNGLRWTDPHIYNNRSRITITRAIGTGRNIQGVLAIDLDLNVIREEINQAQIANTGYISILDDNGVVVASSQVDLVGENLSSAAFFVDSRNQAAEMTEESGQGALTTISGMVYDKGINDGNFGIYYERIPNLGLNVYGQVQADEMATEESTLQTILLLVVLLTIIVAGIAAVLSSGLIASMTNALMRSFKRVQDGDLTTRLEKNELINPASGIIKGLNKWNKRRGKRQTTDSGLDPKGNEIHQIGLAFNRTLETFEDTIQVIQGNSQNVSSMAVTLTEIADQTSRATAEVSQTINGVAEATSMQTQDTEETANQMNGLSLALNDIDSAVAKMGQQADTTMIVNGENIRSTQEVNTKWSDTLETLTDLRGKIEEVDDDIQNIEGIVKAITTIASRTNLLALNASIEAARAGDAGRGFAVVADEIRKLAEQSATSSKDIQTIIGSIQDKSSGMVDHLEETNKDSQVQTEKINDAISASENVASSLEQLVASMLVVMESSAIINERKEEVAAQLESIAAGAEENSAGTEEVSANAEEILATMQEFTSHINELENVALILKESAEQFVIEGQIEEDLDEAEEDLEPEFA